MTSVSFVSYIVALMKIIIHNQSSLELLNVNFKLYFNHNTYILYISKFLAQDNDFPAFWLVA